MTSAEGVSGIVLAGGASRRFGSDKLAATFEGRPLLERAGRIVVLEPDLAYAASAYRELESTALALAGTAPLTPATLRDATGTSRKYVMAILADLDRRGVLRRTPDGHVPGPRAPAVGSPTR